MAARTFEDSAGATWEVFEVRRASSSPNGVSAGLESGWLTFVHGTDKRRLAPFPPDWERAANAELERLCAQARAAMPREAGPGHAWPRTNAPARATAPRTAPPGIPEAPRLAAPATRDSGDASDMSNAGDAADVERAVRAFAHEARLQRVPAIEAMVRLKAMLLQRFPGPSHPARDTASVRRWFVDAFYFEPGGGER